MELPEIVTVSGREFKRAKKRFYMNVSVYANEEQSLFMRLGDPVHIEREYTIHRTLEKYGYPVATIVERGKWEEYVYYIEESQGDELLSFVLHKDTMKHGMLTNETYEAFAALVATYIEGQVQTATNSKDAFSLLEETTADLAKELPHLSSKIEQAKKKYKEYFLDELAVFSHGDFNTHNLFWKGIIDVEGFSWMPFGYDVTTMLFNGLFFPVPEQFEMRRLFTFSTEERVKLLAMIDSIALNHNLIPFHTYVDHHLMLRTLWAAKGMDHTPVLQKWRFILAEKVLDAYLAGKSVVEVVDEYTA